MTSELQNGTPDNRIDLAAIEAELRPQSSDKVRDCFLSSHNGAARLIATAAVCVKLLKERGEDMRGIPMVGTYLRIASGQVLPELVWKFIESPNRQRVERLPLDDQRKLAANPMVPVIEAKQDGEFGYTKRFVDLAKAPAEVARLVVGPDGLRTPEEQLAFLGSQKARAAVPVAAPPAAEEPVAEPLDRRITVKLSASDLEALKIHAALAHISESEMARRFLVRSGAFKRPKT